MNLFLKKNILEYLNLLVLSNQVRKLKNLNTNKTPGPQKITWSQGARNTGMRSRVCIPRTNTKRLGWLHRSVTLTWSVGWSNGDGRSTKLLSSQSSWLESSRIIVRSSVPTKDKVESNWGRHQTPNADLFKDRRAHMGMHIWAYTYTMQKY